VRGSSLVVERVSKKQGWQCLFSDCKPARLRSGHCTSGVDADWHQDFLSPNLEIGSVGVSHQYVYDASIEMLHDGSIVTTLQDQSHVSDAPLGLLW